MEIQNHRILRLNTKHGAPVRAQAATDSSPQPQDGFVPSRKPDDFPDISGLAAFSRQRSIAVKDTKLEDNSKRVLLVNNGTGKTQDLDIDWSKTGRARDLEAITPGKGRGNYLAVEGSSFGENKARLFELSVNSKGGEARKSHVLPDFGQEVEGLATRQNKDGSQTVLFGGRGDDNGQSTIFWGSLTEDGLRFTPDGLKGQKVDSPHLGPGQRSIADMAVDREGQLWGTAAVDNGDEGPFDSQVYRLGSVTSEADRPFQANASSGVQLAGTKAEAIAFTSDGKFLVGSDNESFGGRFESFNLLS